MIVTRGLGLDAKALGVAAGDASVRNPIGL